MTAPLTLALVLPTRMALNSNGREHPQVRAKRVREIRETVTYALASKPHYTQPVNIDCAITWADNRRRDAFNWAATLKPVVDQLVTLGILDDDSNRHVHRTSIWATEPKPSLRGYVQFHITITEAEQCARGAA